MRKGFWLNSLRSTNCLLPENHFLQIRFTLDFLAGYGGYIETEPKTAKGRRKIMLPDFMIEALKQHRVQQLEL
jgi:hypothetical protein